MDIHSFTDQHGNQVGWRFPEHHAQKTWSMMSLPPNGVWVQWMRSIPLTEIGYGGEPFYFGVSDFDQKHIKAIRPIKDPMVLVKDRVRETSELLLVQTFEADGVENYILRSGLNVMINVRKSDVIHDVRSTSSPTFPE